MEVSTKHRFLFWSWGQGLQFARRHQLSDVIWEALCGEVMRMKLLQSSPASPSGTPICRGLVDSLKRAWVDRQAEHRSHFRERGQGKRANKVGEHFVQIEPGLSMHKLARQLQVVTWDMAFLPVTPGPLILVLQNRSSHSGKTVFFFFIEVQRWGFWKEYQATT